MPSRFVIVSGAPATGKTTLGRRLAHDLGLPFFGKDDLKETLFDALGARDREWSRQLGVASFFLLRHLMESLAAAGQSAVVEANFRAEYDAPFLRGLAERHDARLAQVWLTAAPEVVAERFATRAASPERHPGHVEMAHAEEFRAALLGLRDAPLPLDGPLCVVETDDFASVDYAAILASVRAAQGTDAANAATTATVTDTAAR